jgi:hypothetical protein
METLVSYPVVCVLTNDHMKSVRTQTSGRKKSLCPTSGLDDIFGIFVHGHI